MRRRLGRGLGLLVFVFLGACSVSIPTKPTTTASALATPSAGLADWALDFTRSGGIAGRTVSLHLLSTGEMTASDLDSGRRVQSQASAEEIAEIGRLLGEALPFLADRRPRGCPDCFTYTLTVDLGGSTYLGRATDVDMSGLGALVQVLSGLLGRALSGQP